MKSVELTDQQREMIEHAKTRMTRFPLPPPNTGKATALEVIEETYIIYDARLHPLRQRVWRKGQA